MTVVVVGRSAGATLVVVVFGRGTGSTGVELSAMILVEGVTGTVLVVVAVNRFAVDGRLNGTGTRNDPATTDLLFSLVLLKIPSGFL